MWFLPTSCRTGRGTVSGGAVCCGAGVPSDAGLTEGVVGAVRRDRDHDPRDHQKTEDDRDRPGDDAAQRHAVPVLLAAARADLAARLDPQHDRDDAEDPATAAEGEHQRSDPGPHRRGRLAVTGGRVSRIAVLPVAALAVRLLAVAGLAVAGLAVRLLAVAGLAVRLLAVAGLAVAGL